MWTKDKIKAVIRRYNGLASNMDEAYCIADELCRKNKGLEDFIREAYSTDQPVYWLAGAIS